MPSLAEYGNMLSTDHINCPDNTARTVADVQELGHTAATMLFPEAIRAARDVQPAKIVLIGPSQCGKDETAKRLCRLWNRGFHGSSSWLAMPYIAHVMRSTENAMYECRHQYRAFMYYFCKGLRQHDPTFLVRLSLRHSPMSLGLRDKVELDASREAGLLPFVVWIERQVRPDPTLELTWHDADMVLLNMGTLNDLQRRVEALAKAIGITQ